MMLLSAPLLGMLAAADFVWPRLGNGWRPGLQVVHECLLAHPRHIAVYRQSLTAGAPLPCLEDRKLQLQPPATLSARGGATHDLAADPPENCPEKVTSAEVTLSWICKAAMTATPPRRIP